MSSSQCIPLTFRIPGQRKLNLDKSNEEPSRKSNSSIQGPPLSVKASMLRSQWLRSQGISRSEYNWSLKHIPCEKIGVDRIVVICAKEEVDTHEGVVKATFLRTRISLIGYLPKEFGVKVANSEDFIATLSNFLGGVFMTQTNKSTQRESIPSSIQKSIQGEEQSEEESKEEEEETSEELFIEQCDEVSSKNEFDRSRANFDYHYCVIGGCHSVEARRQLAQEFPQNVHFKEVKCIVYAGLTPLEAKLLAWDHNHDNEYRVEMKFIQKNQFFHNEFIDLCEGDKSKATFEF
eukprot:Gb_14004 [translate_table: standard]